MKKRFIGQSREWHATSSNAAKTTLRFIKLLDREHATTNQRSERLCISLGHSLAATGLISRADCRQPLPWDYFRVVRDAPETAMTARIGDYIVRTARNRALPSATRS